MGEREKRGKRFDSDILHKWILGHRRVINKLNLMIDGHVFMH